MNALLGRRGLAGGFRTYVGLTHWPPPLGLLPIGFIAWVAFAIGQGEAIQGFMERFTTWALTPDDAPGILRFMLWLAFFGGIRATFRSLDVDAVGFAKLLPAVRERLVLGTGLAALAYGAIAAALALSTHSWSVAAGVAGVTAAVFTLAAVLFDDYMPWRASLMLLGAVILCALYPQPLATLVQRWGMFTGGVGVGAAALVLARLYRPTLSMRAGTLSDVDPDTGEVEPKRDDPPAVAVEYEVAKLADARDVEVKFLPRDGDGEAIPPFRHNARGYMAACFTQQGKTPRQAIKSTLIWMTLLAIAIYAFDRVGGVMIGVFLSINRWQEWQLSVPRLLPLTREERLMRAYATALVHNVLRLATLVAILGVLLWLDPFPNKDQRTYTASHVMALSAFILTYPIPIMSMLSAWVPQGKSGDPAWFHSRRVTVSGLAVGLFLVAAGVPALHGLKGFLRAGDPVIAERIIAFLVTGVVTYLATWQILRRRARHSDLLA